MQISDGQNKNDCMKTRFRAESFLLFLSFQVQKIFSVQTKEKIHKFHQKTIQTQKKKVNERRQKASKDQQIIIKIDHLTKSILNFM